MLSSAVSSLQLDCYDKKELTKIAEDIVSFAGDTRVWLLYGEMGAGKTTLVKAICTVMGSGDLVSSPTYSLVNQYEDSTGGAIYHFDFYRIGNESEAFDIGTEEYFRSGCYCFVEWPSKIPSLLPESHYLEIGIASAETMRTIAVTKL